MTAIDLELPSFLRRNKDNTLPEFQKPLVYSFTMLNTADTCLHRCYRQYVKRDIPYVETPEMKWGNDVHTAMEYRIGGKPLPGAIYNPDGTVKTPSMQHWEPLAAAFARPGARAEAKMGVTREGKPTDFFGRDVFFRGKVDVTIIAGTTAFLPDWKTNKNPREDPFELECQAVMVRAANPYLTKIRGCFVWLSQNRIGQIHELGDTNSTWARINNKVERIEDAMQTNEWPKTKGPLCGWCPVKECEHWYDAKA